MRLSYALCIALSTLAVSGIASADEAATGKKLANLLMGCRGVVAANPDLIADPTKASVDAAAVKAGGINNYKKATGEEFSDSDEPTKKLLAAVEAVINDAKAGKYKKNWLKDKKGKPAPFAGKFLPARFAGEVAARFSKSTGGKIIMRLTTEKGRLVNPANAPDAWETAGLEKYKKGELKAWDVLFEKAPYNGKPASRTLKVEFYAQACLKCHGEDGPKIHPDKSKGSLNDIGGAVSVVMF